MSIDAVIASVTRNDDGTATLHLVARDPRHAPAGQPSLIVLNPRIGLEAAAGTEIWGGDSYIMVGETKWADRIGYGSIRLVEAGKRKGERSC